MAKKRAEEEWARGVVERELGVPVVIHDDNSDNYMYDLEAYLPGEQIAAIEVTAAHDQRLAELYGVLDGRLILGGIVGGWNVHIRPTARYRRVVKALPCLLADLEQRGISTLRAADSADLEAFGIEWAWQGSTSFPGSVYVHLDLPSERTGGYVTSDTGPLLEWIEAVLVSELCQGMRRNLRASDAAERHIFLLLPGFTGDADFEVWSPLTHDSIELPRRPPMLPDPVTHVWVASTFDLGAGLRWTPDSGWTTFHKHPET